MLHQKVGIVTCGRDKWLIDVAVELMRRLVGNDAFDAPSASQHLPSAVGAGNRGRCAVCNEMTVFKCRKCDEFFCITSKQELLHG